VIVEEGAPVGDLKDLIGAIQGRGARRALTLSILRGNARMTVAATLDKLADASDAPTDPAQKQAAHDRLIAARKAFCNVLTAHPSRRNGRRCNTLWGKPTGT
jgi:hypothetical protein